VEPRVGQIKPGTLEQLILSKLLSGANLLFASGEKLQTALTIKAVRRQLTCFFGRLHLDVTGEDLATFLHQHGILDAQCEKLVVKNGLVF